MAPKIYPGDMINFLRWQRKTPVDVEYDPLKCSLEGQTVIMTGSNTGLGFDTCHKLVHLRVSRLVLAVRNLSKGEDAKKALLKTADEEQIATGILVWELDMKSFESIRAFAQRARDELDRLDVMFCNAGIENAEFKTIDDIEETHFINVVSTLYLGALVLTQLRENSLARSTNTKLLFTGSMVHMLADGTILRDAPEGQMLKTMTDKARDDFTPTYLNSKFMMTLGARELARREPLPETGGIGQVVIAHVNPGWCATELFRNRRKNIGERFMFSLMGRESEEGSRTLAHAVVFADETCHGKYLSECEPKKGGKWIEDPNESDKTQQRFLDELLDVWAQQDPSVRSIVPSRNGQVLPMLVLEKSAGRSKSSVSSTSPLATRSPKRSC